ncbi:hypothetical protein I302_103002 [Kwoniella bestiolae CBS 10118]|uniref:Uncharacterized protein n=1 Tax=Kwoniella bestiolae CBS 10118 TaxID=1296100 RepID=A0A1B9GGI9_9TREE|nr:hypothetical protein I302_01698 [Kwoniella bestiolae CBS 10118]OCF30179.1 hypothetical protein I302_01698 [Kwoniella bestiolae CBS 10118]
MNPMITLVSRKHTKYISSLILLDLTLIPHITSHEVTSSSTLTIAKADIHTESLHPTQSPEQQSQNIFIHPNPTYLFPYPPPAPTATTTQTQLVYLPIPPSTQSHAPSPFLHPLAIILILCSILGFLSTLLNLPFNTDMSSSSSSARPSSSSSKPSSSSSSSSSRPSSSSSASGSGSSSSTSSAKPPSPQAVPNITANAWMSFFLFCCLVLIILQGPLGLTGGNILPSFGTPSGGWGYGVGGMPGCADMVSTYVPWCHSPPPVVAPQSQPQIQVQQVVQNPPAGSYGVPGVGAHQMGGQGGFASPNGGGGWSWYSNAGDGGVVRQQPAYYPPQQRTVQYQRPGLQIQVHNARGNSIPQQVVPQYYDSYYPHNTCPTSPYPYPYQYAPGYTLPHGYGHGYASGKRCTPWQPWNCNYLPNVFGYAHQIPSHSMDIGGNGGVNIQSQHIGTSQPQAIPAIPVTPPPQPIVPPPSAIASISNLENAFYPLLVGAIALLVVFDYAS